MIDKDKEIEELNSRLAATSPEMFEDLLKEREQLLQERQDFQRKLEVSLNISQFFLIFAKTMEQELEKSMYEFEERRKNLENEVSEQVAEKVKELLEVNKSLESNLMEELRKSDEKILSLEAQNKALSHKLRESDEKLREFSALSQRKSEDLLQTRDESLEKELQKYEKSLEDARKTHLFELSAKEAAIKFLEAELQESSKRADAVLLEKTRVLERESALKLKLEGFEERVAELQKEFEEKLQQLLRTSAAEKEKLEQEVHHLREEVNKNRNTFPQSMNNLMNLKEDIEVFNNFMEEQPPQNLALIIPSRKELGNCENTEKNEKNAEKLVEELKEELRNNRESEISQWERELSQEKELFRSFRQEKLKESEEKNREIQEKTLELQEKARIIQEKDKEISQFSQKLRELFALEELKREKSRLESSINSLKQAFYEEKAFLQAELQRSESQAIDAKLRLAEISLDKEFLQMKLKKMDKELKNKGIVLKI